MTARFRTFKKCGKYKDQVVTCAQRKMDGHRTLVFRHPGGRTEVLTRVGTDIWPKLQEVPHIRSLILNLPVDTVLDSELLVDGGFATDVKTAINDKSEDLQLWGFALPLLNGVLRIEDDYQRVVQHILDLGILLPETEFFAGPRRVDADRWKEKAVELGWEGFILKDRHWAGWYKLKPTWTVDGFVSDYTYSDSDTYFGQIRGIEVSVLRPDGTERVICNTGNGLTAEFKDNISGDEESLIGQVVEIEYDEVAAKGRLKFPRIVRFREDKLREECTEDQLHVS